MTPYDIKPSTNPRIEVNLDFFLTDHKNTIKPEQATTVCQTDEFHKRPPTPPYIPKKTGIDSATQVEDVGFLPEILPHLPAFSQFRLRFSSICISSSCFASPNLCLALLTPNQKVWAVRFWQRSYSDRGCHYHEDSGAGIASSSCTRARVRVRWPQLLCFLWVSASASSFAKVGRIE